MRLKTIVFFCLISANIYAQEIVSTSPQNRVAIFEEFGGYKCEFCPDGHSIANYIAQIHQEEFIPINYQVGDFAIPNDGTPDLRSDYGAAIANETNLVGYPAATVNRRVFPGLNQGLPGTTAINRNNWNTAVNQIVNMNAPVNIAAEASIDLSTGELTIKVEIYYTSNTWSEQNYLHIALLQDSIIAPQLDGNNWVSDYTHRHVFRDMITGETGDAIMECSAGHFEERTYTYSLQGTYRNIIVDPSQIELVAFVTKSHHDILNGTYCKPSIIMNALDANVLQINPILNSCGSFLEPSFILRNDGLEHVYTAEIMYRVNGGDPSYYQWEGELCSFEYAEVQLPAIEFFPYYNGLENVVTIELLNINQLDDNNDWNNLNDNVFYMAPITEMVELELELETDDFGYETYWEIMDENGSIVAFGGNQNVGLNGGGQQMATPSNLGAYPSNAHITELISLPSDGCYQFQIYDDYGDGVCCNYGSGSYELKEVGGAVLVSGGAFEVKESKTFEKGTLITSNVEEQVLDWELTLAPNPTDLGSALYLSYSVDVAEAELRIIAANGQVVYQQILLEQSSSLEIATQAFSSGIYFVQLRTAEKAIHQKWIIQ